MPLLWIAATPVHAAGQLAQVVARRPNCDYFIAGDTRGLFVLQWQGGYDPEVGDRIYGEIASEGMKNVVYLPFEHEGRVRVEDHVESDDQALEAMAHHCRQNGPDAASPSG